MSHNCNHIIKVKTRLIDTLFDKTKIFICFTSIAMSNKYLKYILNYTIIDIVVDQILNNE